MDRALERDLRFNLVKKTCYICKNKFKFHNAVDGLKKFDKKEFFFDGFIDNWTDDWVHYGCKEEHYIIRDKNFPSMKKKRFEMQLTVNELLYLPQKQQQ